MKKTRMGILCPSEIAFRRFMPALQKLDGFEYIGIAHANQEEWFGDNSSNYNDIILTKEREKAEGFAQTYGGKVFDGYKKLLNSPEVDAVYLPLPPALHCKWGMAVLEQGKHLLMEKPFTTRLEDTVELLSLAKKKGLAVHENYMFQYHSQLDFIQQAIHNCDIGELRLIRIAFGFPFRGSQDFRYNAALGGGALLDCGGYTVKLATMLLGETTRVVASQLNYKNGFDIDMYGSATMENEAGLTAQISFGMDNSYKCELEFWGSSGTLYTNRILTAPEGLSPTVIVRTSDGEKNYELSSDDSFCKSIQAFKGCLDLLEARENNYAAIERQSKLMGVFFGRRFD